MSPQQQKELQEKQQEEILSQNRARKKAEIMEKILAGVSPMNKLSNQVFDSREASPSGVSIASSSQDSAIVQVRESGVLHEEDVDDLPVGEWQWTTRRLIIVGSVAVGVVIVVVLCVVGFVFGM